MFKAVLLPVLILRATAFVSVSLRYDSYSQIMTNYNEVCYSTGYDDICVFITPQPACLSFLCRLLPDEQSLEKQTRVKKSERQNLKRNQKNIRWPQEKEKRL
jgi:hypothetical protein